MIDLEQVKKRVEEIAGTRGFCNCCEGKGRMWVAGKIHRATYSEATICCPDCGGSGKTRLDAVSTDELLSLTHDLIAGNETLQREKAELEIEKNIPPSLNIRCCEDGVWLELKATTGRSACINLSNMGKEHPGDIIAAAILDWCRDTAQENRVALEHSAELESKLCGMREALELILPHARDYVGKHEVGSNRRYIEIAEQALSITPNCKHKEENEKQLASLQAELLDTKKWCFDDTAVASLREKLKAVREENDRLQAELDEIKESTRTDHKPKVQSDLPS